MTIRSHNPQVGHLSSELEWILRKFTTVTGNSTPINETVFAAKFARARLVDDLSRDELIVRPDQLVDDHVRNESPDEGVVVEKPVPGDESSTESSHSG